LVLRSNPPPGRPTWTDLTEESDVLSLAKKNIIGMLQLPATSASFLQLVAKWSGFIEENSATFVKDHLRVALPRIPARTGG